MRTCTTDFDCASNLVCLPGILSWAPSGSNGTFCDCNSLMYGFLKATPTSTSCDVLGPQTLYLIAMDALFISIYVALLIHFMFCMARLKRSKRLVSNSIVTTLLLITVANIFAILGFGIRVFTLHQPLQYVYSVNGRKAHPLTPAFEGLSIVGESFFLYGTSNLPLVWAEIVFRTQKFTTQKNVPSVSKLRIGVRSYQLLVLLCKIAKFAATGSVAFAIGSIAVALGLIGVVVVFVLARRWIVKLMKQISSDTRTILARIDALTNTVVICISTAVLSFLAFAYFAFSGAAFSCLPGEFCPYHLLAAIPVLCGTVATAACQYYCALGLGCKGCSFTGRSTSSRPKSTLNLGAVGSSYNAESVTMYSKTHADSYL